MNEIEDDFNKTEIPKGEALVYESLGGDEISYKKYYFLNQNYYYEISLTGGTNTGVQYTQEAEDLFDKIVESFKFN